MRTWKLIASYTTLVALVILMGGTLVYKIHHPSPIDHFGFRHHVRDGFPG